MVLVRITRKLPELAFSFKNTVQPLLNHVSYGVVVSGTNAAIAMIETEPQLGRMWSKFSEPFTTLLTRLSKPSTSPDNKGDILNDPCCRDYLIIKTMKALTLLANPSDKLDTILQLILTPTETRRDIRVAVVCQTVETVVALSRNPALRAFTINQVGRLLSTEPPNGVYSALSSFARIVHLMKSMANRESDWMALQLHRSAIVKHLDHNDPLIHRRASYLISALADQPKLETVPPTLCHPGDS
jgi:hypothetical protein